ncbi:hypothetical protein TcCL_NonESM07622 [Trypanosoma cruzi]|nr:hypothetical protein TcCL_NonESM07622 [Trypanosoma cruzi]
MTPLRRSHSTLMRSLGPRAVLSLTGVTTPRRCVVAWIQADVGGGPAVLTGGGGPALPSPQAGQRAAGLANNPLRAACVLPVVADRSGVPRFPETSQAAVREGGVDHRSVRAAGGGYKMAQKHNQRTAGATPRKQSRMANSGAHGVKGQFIPHSPGGTRAQTVHTTAEIAARATQTL